MNRFRDGLERIRRDGWIQGALQRKKPTQKTWATGVCLVGGLWGDYDRLLNDPEGAEILMEVIAEQHPDSVSMLPRELRTVPTTVIPHFNDGPFRTRDQIERVVEKAAVRWDERL